MNRTGLRRAAGDWRAWAIVGLVVVVISIALSMSAVNKSNRVATQANETTAALKAQIDARTRAAVVSRYSDCLFRNDSRGRIRELVGDELTILFGRRTLTPMERALGVAVTRRGVQIYPNTDCRPLIPPRLTAGERASLFHPDPIPKLRIPVR